MSRAQIVWVAFAGAMTAGWGLLSTLESGAPSTLAATPLAAVSSGAVDIDRIFDTRAALGARSWRGIVIHHSGELYGSPEALAETHRQRGLHGLGHHFVISNGAGAGDGELFVGYRWLDQLPGAHAAGPDEAYYNEQAIGVCLIGDGDRRPFTDAQLQRLASLINALQARLDLPGESVLLHRDIASTTSPGRLFPESAFRALLATAPQAPHDPSPAPHAREGAPATAAALE